jgi:tetratricopeptide (TPR) repeat protein
LARSSDPAVWAQAQWFDERAIAILAGVPPERNRSLPFYLMGRLWMRRGEELERTGSPEAPGYYRLAVQAFERAKPIDLAFNQSARAADLQSGVRASAIPDTGNELLWDDLASALEHLNQLPQAAEARRYALRLAPQDGALYLGMEKIEARLGHADLALHWAAEAMLLTQTPAAAAHFAAAYRGVHAEGCEPLAGLPPAANLSCPSVKSVVCGAELQLLQSFQDEHVPQLAAAYSQTSLTGDACKAGY